QLSACHRTGLRQLESIAKSKHGVDAQIVLTGPLLCLRVVMLQELVPADAIGIVVVALNRETQEVCCEPAEIEPRIGAAALFEPIEVEAPVNAVVDAVPPQRTVDWSHDARHARPRSIREPP